jgi:glycine/D-amino acid oxidase-like deaminating enzyme
MGEPHPHPDHLWRNPEPRGAYEVVIVGAGGHGLATAYYLAKNHGITDVAVLERGWLAGGTMARNTTVIRSSSGNTSPTSSITTSCSASAACSTWSTASATAAKGCGASTRTG